MSDDYIYDEINNELEQSLTDVEIDEIIGKENSDTEGEAENISDIMSDEAENTDNGDNKARTKKRRERKFKGNKSVNYWDNAAQSKINQWENNNTSDTTWDNAGQISIDTSSDTNYWDNENNIPCIDENGEISDNVQIITPIGEDEYYSSYSDENIDNFYIDNVPTGFNEFELYNLGEYTGEIEINYDEEADSINYNDNNLIRATDIIRGNMTENRSENNSPEDEGTPHGNSVSMPVNNAVASNTDINTSNGETPKNSGYTPNFTIHNNAHEHAGTDNTTNDHPGNNNNDNSYSSSGGSNNHFNDDTNNNFYTNGKTTFGNSPNERFKSDNIIINSYDDINKLDNNYLSNKYKTVHDLATAHPYIEKIKRPVEMAAGMTGGVVTGLTSKIMGSESMVSQGFAEYRKQLNSLPVTFVKTLLASSGVDTLALAKQKDKDYRLEIISNKLSKSTVSIDDVRKGNLTQDVIDKLKEDKLKKRDIAYLKKYGNDIADRITLNRELKSIITDNNITLSKKGNRQINSDQFLLNNMSQKEFNKAIGILAKNNNSRLSSANLTAFSEKKLKRLLKKANKGTDGLTKKDASIIKSVLAYKRSKGIKALKKHARFGKGKRLFSMSVNALVSSDENMADGLREMRKYGAYTKVSLKATKMLTRGGVYIGKNAYKYTLKKPVDRMVKQLKKPVDVAKTKAKAHINNTKTKVKNSSPVNKARQTKEKIKSTRQYQWAAKRANSINKTASMAGKGAKGVGKKVGHAVGTIAKPFKFIKNILDKIFGVFSAIKMIVFIIVLVFIIIYLICVLIAGSINVSGVASDAVKEAGSIVLNNMSDLEKLEYYCMEYDDYDDMQSDIDDLLSYSDATYEEAVAFGEGVPSGAKSTSGDGLPDNQVYYGHTISRWGDDVLEPEGYKIHYLDAYGNELASKTSNAKDVEVLCMMMIDNDLSSEYQYRSALRKLDDLIYDMYNAMIYVDEETGLPFTYKASPIYYCSSEGCEEYEYKCNEVDYYNTFYEMQSAHVHFATDDLYPDYDPVYANYEVPLNSGYEFNEELGIEEYVGQEFDCCHHTVGCCYGHRTVDIYITVYDIEYALANNITPKEPKSSYQRLTRDFMKKGAWTNPTAAKRARDVYYGTEIAGVHTSDWYSTYGVLIDGASFGFSTGSVTFTPQKLSKEEYNDIVNSLRAQGIDDCQLAVIIDALNHVGSYSYSLTREGHLGGIYNNSGVSECSGFVSGVLNRTGIDYYGDKNKDNFSAATFKSMSNGSMMPGSVISNGSHVMIYVGNIDGKNYTLECNSAFGGYPGGSMLTVSSDKRLSKYSAYNYW